MLINIIFKSIIVYLIILLSLKFMGKREVGQVSLFDFAILLVIADILVISVDIDNNKFWYYFVATITLCLIQRFLAFVLLKFKKVRPVLDGKKSVIIFNGKLMIKEMERQRYNMNDLITQLRLLNIASLSEVKYLILENNGSISAFRYKDNPLNPFPVIVSGEIESDNLKLLNLDEEWLKNKLKGKNIKDIYYANIDENKELYIMPFEYK